MSSISIKQANITELHVDALVNAVNTRLQHGSGVCGAIFTAAGAAPRLSRGSGTEVPCMTALPRRFRRRYARLQSSE